MSRVGRAAAQSAAQGRTRTTSVKDDRGVKQVFTRIGRPGPRAVARRRVFLACGTVVTVLALTACGSGSSSVSAGAQPANVSAAQARIAPFTGAPSDFPVTDPLSKPLPPGKAFVFLQCSTPFCALAGKGLQAAVAGVGGKFTALNAGATAQTSQAAASSALAMRPDVVFVTVDPSLYGDGLRKLSDAGVKVVSISITKDVRQSGVTFNYIGEDEIAEDGRLMADWVVAKQGNKADVVFYGLPTFDFSKPLEQAFRDELKKNCPSCGLRTSSIDVATIGTTAPHTVVTDLQAHPSTNVAVFSSLQIAAGLPAEMKAANLSVTTIGRGPTPQNLQDIKNGAITAGLAIDTPVSVWTAVDAAARLILGGQPTDSEQAGDLDKQFLTQKDLTFDPTNGWVGYPDYAQRFARLWRGAAG